MITRLRNILFAFVLVGAWVAVSAAQETFTLEHKFDKGKTYHYASTTNTKMTQEMGGQQMHVNMEAWLSPSISLEKVTPEGNLVLVYAADSARTHIKAPNMDSTMTLTNLIGKRTRLTVTPQGEIVKREVIDTVKMDRTMAGAGLKDMVRFPRLAAKPVKIGDTWNVAQTDTNDFGGGKILVTTNTVYTLAGKEKMLGHDCLKVTYSGNITSTGKGSMMGMDLFIEGTGKSTGTYYFDPAKGMFVQNDGKAETETTMAATGQQNMTIPISSSAETTFTLKE